MSAMLFPLLSPMFVVVLTASLFLASSYTSVVSVKSAARHGVELGQAYDNAGPAYGGGSDLFDRAKGHIE